MEPKNSAPYLNLKSFLSLVDISSIQTGEFKPVKVIKESVGEGAEQNEVLIFVTDEPEFIDFLKSEGISGRMRSTQSQRVRDEKAR